MKARLLTLPPVLACALAGPALVAQVRPVPLEGAVPSVQTSRPDVGSVERLEVVSLTRQHLSARILTSLPAVAAGPRQTFTGKVSVLNVGLPVASPVAVSVGGTGSRTGAAFSIELELRDIPPSLPAQLRPGAFDVQIEGVLHGDGGTRAPVFAVGVLRYGTSDIQADPSLGAQFVRLGGMQVRGLSLTTVEGEATAVLYNPFRFPIDLVDFRYSIWLGDRKVCEGSRHGVRIHPERENEVAFSLSAQSADLVAAVGSAMSNGGRMPARFIGGLAMKAGTESVTMPLNLSGTLEIGR